MSAAQVIEKASTKQNERLSWEFLDGFSRKLTPPEPNWHVFEMIKRAVPLNSSLRRYKKLLNKWDIQLNRFGGDPSTLDWKTFRPLRLSREEDWSDWLSWLFKNSVTGEFASALFNQPSYLFNEPKVIREDVTEDYERRGDILIISRPRLGIMLEVKIGDEQFEKTFETGRKLQAKHKQEVNAWKNFILIPNGSLALWKEVSESGNLEPNVPFILWEDVIKSMRRCLWLGLESEVWRTWAWTFCGAIESGILRLERQKEEQPKMSQFTSLVRWIEILDPPNRRQKLL